jgi:hypothetical protein
MAFFILLPSAQFDTLIILFSEILKISKIVSSKSKNIVKENRIFKNIPFVEMNVSKLINYSTNMC